MITKEYNTWKFEELSEDMQEKVLERYRYFNVEDSFWHDYDEKTGYTTKELQRMKVKSAPELLTYKKLYFDLDRSWYIQFVDAKFTDEDTARKFLGVPKSLWETVEWRIVDCPSREGNTRLEYEEGYGRDYREFTPKQIEILDRAVERFSDKVEQALRDLQKNYEYSCSDEAVKESLIINDYDFDENGKIS